MTHSITHRWSNTMPTCESPVLAHRLVALPYLTFNHRCSTHRCYPTQVLPMGLKEWFSDSFIEDFFNGNNSLGSSTSDTDVLVPGFGSFIKTNHNYFPYKTSPSKHILYYGIDDSLEEFNRRLFTEVQTREESHPCLPNDTSFIIADVLEKHADFRSMAFERPNRYLTGMAIVVTLIVPSSILSLSSDQVLLIERFQGSSFSPVVERIVNCRLSSIEH